MKKIINILATTVVLIGISILPANANGNLLSNIPEGKTVYCQGTVCSTTPPAPESVAGFAVVDNAGIVKGVIACNIAACPSTLEGTYMGCTNCSLVQQTPGNKEGNAWGIPSTPENVVTYNPQTNVFTQESTNSSILTTTSETTDTTTLTATISSSAVTFGLDSFVDGKLQYTPVVTSSTSATISVTEELQKEMAMFETPKTRTQLQKAVENKLVLIQRYLNRFYILLNGWLIE